MSFLKNIKNLLGIGPFLLISSVTIECLTIYAKQWISFPIQLSLKIQIISTVILISIFLSGMAWFNFTLNLIHVNFFGGENKLIIHGPFNYVRHPLYSILILTLPLLFILWFTDLLFIIPWIFIFIVSHYIVVLEERTLFKQFGESYKRYQQYVPALFPYRGPNGRRYYSEIMNGFIKNSQDN